MIGCLTETTTCVVAKPLVYINYLVSLFLIRRRLHASRRKRAVMSEVYALAHVLVHIVNQFSSLKRIDTTNKSITVLLC